MARRLVVRHGSSLGRTVVRTRPGFTIELDLQDWISKHVFVTGVFEAGCSNLLGALLRPGDTFVDVGAKVGYFSLLGSQLVGPEGRVIAFEPNPDVRVQIKSNLLRNGFRNVEVLDCALSDSDGELTLFLGPPDNSGLSSFRVPRDSTRSVVVPTRRFDSLFTPEALFPAIVKIDVEGAELQALRGTLDQLTRNRPI